MLSKTVELLSNASDLLHKAIYSMETFNIAVEQKMDDGSLNCTTGGSRAVIRRPENQAESTRWWFDSSRPETIRLAPQGGDGPDIPINDDIFMVSAWWGFMQESGFWKVRLEYRNSSRHSECIKVYITKEEDFEDVLKHHLKVPFTKWNPDEILGFIGKEVVK